MAAAVARAIKTTSPVTSSTKLLLYSISQPPLLFARRPLLQPLSHNQRLFSSAPPSSNRSGDSSLPLEPGSNFSDQLLTKMAPLFPLCDYQHWIVLVMHPKGAEATEEEMINFYFQILAKVVGSKEEATKKMYKVSCEIRPLGFCCEIDEGRANKLKGVSKSVLAVVPDSYAECPNSYVDPLHWNPLHWETSSTSFDGLWSVGGGVVTPIYFDHAVYPLHPMYKVYEEGQFWSIAPAMKSLKLNVALISWQKRHMTDKTMSQIEQAEKITAAFGSLDSEDQRDMVSKIEDVEVSLLERRDWIELMERGVSDRLHQLHHYVKKIRNQFLVKPLF